MAIEQEPTQQTGGPGAAATNGPREHYPDAAWREVDLGPGVFWQAEALTGVPQLRHMFTGAGYNLSERSGEGLCDTPRRRQAVCEALGLPGVQVVSGSQVHAAGVAIVERDPGPGAQPRMLDGLDGLVTTAVGVPLMARTADCPLILVCDPQQHVLGVAHSGWRSTVAHLSAKLIDTMRFAAGGSLTEPRAVIGPCAGACCYEVQDDVLDRVRESQGAIDRWVRRASGRRYLDLELLVADQLAAAGVPAKAIYLARQCTICDRRFYSYRRDGADTGHGALIAGLIA